LLLSSRPAISSRTQKENIYRLRMDSFLRPASPTGLYVTSKSWVTSFTCSLAVELKGSGVQILGCNPGLMITDMLISPIVVGERGKEMLKNFGFVVCFPGRWPKSAADKLLKAVSRQSQEFSEDKLFKPWTPLFGWLPVGWENLTKTSKTPEFELHYREAYRFKA